MNKKSGITMTVLAVSIAVMLLLITASTIIGSGYVNDARYDGFKTMVSAVSDNINAYLLENGELPINNESVLYNSFGSDFAKEVEKKGDQYNRLFIVDISKLNNYTINEGKGDISNGDVFLIAENSNNLYYLKGFTYKDKKYYGLEAEEYDLTNQSLNVSQNDYVRDGLILYYDAINNTGSGHSNTATTWKDLSGNGNDGTIVGISSTQESGWNDNYLQLDGVKDYAYCNMVVPGDNCTIEIVAKYESGLYMLRSDAGLRTYIYSTYTNKGYPTEVSSNFVNSDDNISNRVLKYSTDNGKSTYCNYYNAAKGETKEFEDTSDAAFLSIGSFLNTEWSQGSKEKIYAVRIYNRALTDNEIRANFLMDKEKYGIEAELKDTNVNMSKKLGYVTANLLCQYDGIYNDGENHSNTTSTWKDASGRGNDAVLTGYDFTETSKWTNTGLVNDAGSEQITTANLNIPAASDFTVSVTFKENEFKTFNNANNHSILNSSAAWSAFAFHTWYSNNTTKVLDGEVYIGGNFMSGGATDRFTPTDMNGYKTTVGKTDNITYTYNADTKIAKLYINGAFVNSKVYTAQPEAITNFLTGTANAKTYYNIMIYDRALDEDEVQKNFALDKRRYGIE